MSGTKDGFYNWLVVSKNVNPESTIPDSYDKPRPPRPRRPRRYQKSTQTDLQQKKIPAVIQQPPPPPDADHVYTFIFICGIICGIIINKYIIRKI